MRGVKQDWETGVHYIVMNRREERVTLVSASGRRIFSSGAGRWEVRV